MAGDDVIRRDLDIHGRDDLAQSRHGAVAARCEWAARDRLPQIRRASRDTVASRALTLERWEGVHQAARVRVERIGVEVTRRGEFDDFPGVHDRHAVTHLHQERQVVRDEDD